MIKKFKYVLIMLILMIGNVVIADQSIILADKCKVEGTYSTKEIFRGLVVDDNPTFTLATSMEHGQWNLLVDGVITTSEVNYNNWECIKNTLKIGYDLPGDKLIGEVGVIGYNWNNVDFKTVESFLKLTYNVPVITPTISIYRDIDKINGWYLNAGVNYILKDYKLSANLGWGSDIYNQHYYMIAENKLNDLTLSISKQFVFNTINGKVYIIPAICYQQNVDDKIAKQISNDKNWIISLTTGIEF